MALPAFCAKVCLAFERRSRFLHLQDAGIARDEVAAIGITNQRETTIAWDPKTGKPVHNAIVWQDTRVAADVAELLKLDRQSPDQRKRITKRSRSLD